MINECNADAGEEKDGDENDRDLGMNHSAHLPTAPEDEP